MLGRLVDRDVKPDISVLDKAGQTVRPAHHRCSAAQKQMPARSPAICENQTIRHLNPAAKEGENALCPPQTYPWTGKVAMTRHVQRE